MDAKNIKKAGWEKIKLSKRPVSAGRCRWFLDASRNGENGKVLVSEVFDTEGEARNWVEWAM